MKLYDKIMIGLTGEKVTPKELIKDTIKASIILFVSIKIYTIIYIMLDIIING